MMSQLDKQVLKSNIIKLCKYLNEDRFYLDKPRRGQELKEELKKAYGYNLETIVVTLKEADIKLDYVDDLGNPLLYKQLSPVMENKLMQYIHDEIKDKAGLKLRAELEQRRINDLLTKELGIEV